MDSEREMNEIKTGIIRGLGTTEDIMRKISDAESKGDYIFAYNIAYDAYHYRNVPISEKLEELRKKIDAVQKDLLDNKPFGEIVIQANGLFRSVCCQKFKDAVLANKIGVTVSDCMTGTISLATDDPEIVKKICEEEDNPWPRTDYDYTETDECPFCKKKMSDYFVE